LSETEMEIISGLARTYGVEDIVEISPPIEHKAILLEECKATFLLLVLRPDETDKYTYTGKLFEYIGAGRPIIVLGLKDNAAAKLVTKMGIGAVCETAEEIERLLKKELLAFYKEGKIPMVKEGQKEEFSWENQVQKIISIFNSI
ncbi:MAG: hypothetical protein ACPLPS_10850, partial [bacterium]